MPLPGIPLGLFQHQGTVAGGETWSVGMWFWMTGLTAGTTQAQADQAATDAHGFFKTRLWTGSLQATNPPAIALTNTRFHLYEAAIATASGQFIDVASAGSSASASAAYQALCVSLYSTIAGRSGRGRMYLPFCTGGLSTATCQLAAAPAGQMTAFKNYMSDMNSHVWALPGAPGAVPSVVSRTHATQAGITHMRIDSKPDTQHGRTKRMAAAFTATAVFP